MDKYQKYILLGEYPTYWVVEKKKGRRECKQIDLDKDLITIKQDVDITLTEYIIQLPCVKGISRCWYRKNGKWILSSTVKDKQKKDFFVCEVDFLNRTDEIKITFVDNIADDYIIHVEYVESDKEAYYVAKKKEQYEQLLSEAKISQSVGTDLVNIFFQPCSKDYSRTEIELFKDNNRLATYQVEKNNFFLSITGLAPGKFSYVMKQIGTDGVVLLETDKINFEIAPPNLFSR